MRFSRWMLALFVLWGVLAARIAVAFVRDEPLGGDLALPSLLLFVCTAVIGSRVFSMFAVPPREREKEERT